MGLTQAKNMTQIRNFNDAYLINEMHSTRAGPDVS